VCSSDLAETSAFFSGGGAAQSGAIGDGQVSWLETTVAGPATLSFYWKVSSESGWDFLRFYIDGVEQPGSISGEVDWRQRSVALTSGSHTLHWAYAKDPFCCTGGQDRGWFDQVQLTAMTCSFALNPTTCTHGGGAESGNFGVSAPAGCNWTASTAYSWIHTTMAGSGNGTVSYTVDASGSTSSRSGTITAGGQSFSVSQAGITCTYSLSSS